MKAGNMRALRSPGTASLRMGAHPETKLPASDALRPAPQRSPAGEEGGKSQQNGQNQRGGIPEADIGRRRPLAELHFAREHILP